jgi:hypothetical protein
VALLVGLGQVATGANYPFDVLAGLAVGAACTAALLPLRHRTERLAGRLLRTPVTAPRPQRRELRLGVIALVLLVGLGGWLVAHVQDHGLRIALNRADGRLNHRLPTDARRYRPSINARPHNLGAGRWRPTRARVYGQVTYVNRELDGDVHVVLKAPDGAFVVLEIFPQLPIPAPTTTTASPPGASSATTASTTGGNSTPSSGGPKARSPRRPRGGSMTSADAPTALARPTPTAAGAPTRWQASTPPPGPSGGPAVRESLMLQPRGSVT